MKNKQVFKRKRLNTTIHKVGLLVIAVCFTSACGANNEQDAVLVPESDVLDYQIGAITDFIVDTPYSALIRVTSVDVVQLSDDDKSDDYSEQKFTYHADVLESYRGNLEKSITYVKYSEGGESPTSYEKPFIITLCHSSDEGFYWPGVGSEFLGHSKLRILAKNVAKKSDKKQATFFLCD